MKNKIFIYSLAICSLLGLSSCENEFLDPSAASETQVVNDITGLIALANGLPYRYSVGRASLGYTMPVASGLSTKELRVLNAGNADEDFLEKGGANVQGNNSLVRAIWEQSNLIKATADIILKNSESISDPGTKSGLQSFANLFKAMALGALGEFFEQATLNTTTGASFSARADVLKEAIRLLETAASSLSANAPSAFFNSRIVAGIDMPNTIQALIARYSLMLADYDKALAAANKVDLTKKSSFNFDDVSRNALFDATFSNRNVVEPANATMGLPDALKPDPADKRLAFFINSTAGLNLGRASFYTANSTAVPVYRPGEVILIKAESFARKNQLIEAVTELNKVLTKKAAADVWGIGADLPAYAGANTAEAILTEIYRQRCIELFLTGLKLDDSRRFNRPNPGERTRNFYPYSLTERDNNTNTPADPQG